MTRRGIRRPILAHERARVGDRTMIEVKSVVTHGAAAYAIDISFPEAPA